MCCNQKVLDSGMVKTRSETFAEALREAMAGRKLDIRAVSVATGVTYEHIRQVANGNVLPSANTARKVATVVGIDPTEAENLTARDKIRKKYGKEISQITSKNPELEPIEQRWHRLSPDQKRMLIQLVETMADSDEHKRVYKASK